MSPLALHTQLPVVIYVDGAAESRQAFEYALLDHAQVHAFADPRTALLALHRMGAVDVVVVAGLSFPGMGAVEFLADAVRSCRTATRVIIADLDKIGPALMNAMNLGTVHRFYSRSAIQDPWVLKNIIAEATEASMKRAFEARVVAVMPELLDRMSEAGQGWQVDLILARPSRVLKIVRLLLPYLDLSVQDRVDLLFSGMFCNLASELFQDLTGWESVQATLADCLEMWDGSGPKRKAGDQIPILAQILGVVIGFHNWRMVLLIDRAIARIEGEGGIGPDTLAAFLQMARDKRAELDEIFVAVHRS